MRKPKKILDGGTFFEGPRWHENCWWLSDFYSDGGRIFVLDADGSVIRQFAAPEPSGLGWLPNGELLAVSMKAQEIWRFPDGGKSGEPVLHADLAGVATGKANDMVVDAEGRAWVGAFGFDDDARELPATSPIMRVDPDGSVTKVADDIHFPNSISVTASGDTLIVAEMLGSRLSAFDIDAAGNLSDRRVYCQIAETVPMNEIAPDPSVIPYYPYYLPRVPYAPDGCTIDAEGCVWAGNARDNWIGRFSTEGDLLERIDCPDPGGFAYAVQLGGPEGKTLLMCVAPDWRLELGLDQPRASVWTVDVDVPHHGGLP
jgi:sugar lactone lactonase YvrE